jgi:hypothetical protein
MKRLSKPLGGQTVIELETEDWKVVIQPRKCSGYFEPKTGIMIGLVSDLWFHRYACGKYVVSGWDDVLPKEVKKLLEWEGFFLDDSSNQLQERTPISTFQRNIAIRKRMARMVRFKEEI